MTDPESSADTSLDRLEALEERLRVVSDRLARLDELREEISEPVYRRVREDYEGRLREVEAAIEPLREQADRVRAQAAEEVERLRQSQTAVRLEEEELRLRCSLGELAEAEIGDRLERLGQERERIAGELAEAEALAGGARKSEAPAPSEPEMPEPGTPPEPELPEPELPELESRSVEAPSEPEPLAERAPHEREAPTGSGWSAPPPAATVHISSLPKAAAVPDGGTRLLRFAVLVPEDPAIGGPSEYRVGPLIAIGRTRANQIQLDEASVSRQHAQISLTDRGFVLRDLGSQNGCFVNGERIEERVLEDGDRVLIGTVPLRFHDSRS